MGQDENDQKTHVIVFDTLTSFTYPIEVVQHIISKNTSTC